MPNRREKKQQKAAKAAEKISASQLTKNNLTLDPRLGELLQGSKLEDILTGMALGGKSKKDLADYKFWRTQPVTRFDETIHDEGPIQEPDPQSIPEMAQELLPDFEWVTVDIDDEEQLEQVHQLLSLNYVEDEDSLLRFRYSAAFLKWALLSPGHLKDWHIGVRVKSSRKLVAFISAIPCLLRVRTNTMTCAEVNFLCIHKKLRSKRLAPILIKEVTRQVHKSGIWQAIYTAGVVLPRPLSTCRYFHRTLDWQKLYEIGFTSLPPNSTISRQLKKYQLAGVKSVAGLRPMAVHDVEHVSDLVRRYLNRFDMAPQFTNEEIRHWLLQPERVTEQVVWAFVVEDPIVHSITDVVSFYSLPSTVIGHSHHKEVNAAYLFYYASESAFSGKCEALQERLVLVMNEVLILAKELGFDVFNALTLMDNPFFLEKLKFGMGDGFLNYYLFNYHARPIHGGTKPGGAIDTSEQTGIGLVML